MWDGAGVRCAQCDVRNACVMVPVSDGICVCVCVCVGECAGVRCAQCVWECTGER